MQATEQKYLAAAVCTACQWQTVPLADIEQHLGATQAMLQIRRVTRSSLLQVRVIGQCTCCVKYGKSEQCPLLAHTARGQ